MPAIFKNILVPVDFSINTEVAIKKSLEIIEPTDSVIHLHHVRKTGSSWGLDFRNFFSKTGTVSENDCESWQKKLSEWKIVINENYPGLQIATDAAQSENIEHAIISKAKLTNPDIIIIGKNCRHSQFPFLNTVSPNSIARKTGFPVLMVKPGAIYNRVRSIVVPVGASVPRRKVELILALRKKFRISIHLVTVMKSRQNGSNFSGHALLNTYRFLRDTAQCPLDHEVLHGDNVARSTLKYAQQIKADLLVIDPEREGRITSFPGKHISDELMPDSRLQILTVQS